MAVLHTQHVKIKGITVTLPEKKVSVYDCGREHFTEEEIDKISRGVGVNYFYEAKPEQTASDLCLNSAERLIKDLNWERDSIDGIIFVSQTPDYIAPATACILQHRLGLSNQCIALDINYGCTGFSNGLLMASHLIELKTCKRVLILVGDTLRRLASPLDKGLYFILSDAGSAIGVEHCECINEMVTSIHTDGSGYEGLIVPAGGARKPKTPETAIMKVAEESNIRSEENYYMNGMDIFSFAVKNVPKLINEITTLAGLNKETIDFYFLHQANAYMVKYIAKRARIDLGKCPINIDVFGNTNGSTIPLLLVDFWKKNKPDLPITAVLCAFGVGLSWGATVVSIEDLMCSDIQYL